MDRGIHGRIKSLDIVDGDPSGHFRIRPTRRHGEYNIEVHQLLDREAAPQGYNLTLRAVDWGTPPRQSYKVVPVHLADANDNVPVFSREIYEVSVPESSPPNTPIIRLKVSDRDIGKNAQVFLEIVGGNEGGEFRVNPDTGMLYTVVPLDTETKSLYTLTVSAIDQGNSGTRKQSSAKVKINVADINDNDPVFELTNTTIWVDENEPAGTTVTKVTARDRDSGENAYISYSIANLNEVPFDIDHFSGIIRTSKLIDYESMRRQYILRIRASDWGLPYRRQTEMQLHIRVRDVNDNRPQFERTECSLEVLRSTPLGTEVFTLSAIDFDAGNMISYRMVAGNDDGCFNLDSSSGIISIGCNLVDIPTGRREINVTATDGTHFADITRIQFTLVHIRRTSGAPECRETEREDEYVLNVTVYDLGHPQKSISKVLPVTVLDENDNPPKFEKSLTSFRIPENALNGTVVIVLNATDADTGENGRIRYSLITETKDFKVDPDTGAVTVNGGLNREQQEVYELRIRATDGAERGASLYSDAIVRVTVEDINDNAPVFSVPEGYTVRVREDIPRGTLVIVVMATDADTGASGDVAYKLVMDEAADDIPPFRIDEHSGAMRTTSTLDFEERQIHTLTVRAFDRGHPSLATDTTVTVEIVDDSNAHIFGIVRVEDMDRGIHGRIKSLDIVDGDPSGHFRIRPTRRHGEYNIEVHQLLDREAAPQGYNLTLRAVDWGTPPRQSYKVVPVHLADANDNVPVFSREIYEVSVPESSPPNTPIIRLKVSDRDIGKNAQVFLEIVGGNEGGEFRVNPDTGMLYTVVPLDTETKSLYTLTVSAIDQGNSGTRKQSSAKVKINVADINDNDPVFELTNTTIWVDENEPAGTTVTKVTARDRDSGENAYISYSIANLNEVPFDIDHFSGIIRTSKLIDYESMRRHEKNNMPRSDSSHSEDFVSLPSRYGENVHTPEFIDFPFEVRINETVPLGTVVAVIRARDRDLGYNGKLVFGISDGDNDSVFRLDPETGEFKVIGYLDREREDEYVLNVTVYDLGHPQKSISKVLPVTVLDENDNPPKFEKSLTSFRIPENALNGTVVIVLNATDADTGENGRIRYSLITETKDFKVDPDTGAVTVNGDSIVNNRRIRATDGAERGASLYSDAIVRVTVEDINDNAPVFSVPEGYTVRVREDIPRGTLVIVVMATDADTGASGDVAYKLVMDEAADDIPPFRIDEHSGAMRTTSTLDFEERQIHTLTVRAFDRGHPSLATDTTVTVEIVDVNEIAIRHC
uniref:Cadherin domain-containing protein n=1 Tax=Lutzomyia longipalpis TaxID=7200 RepID=A0A1B0CII9_LUTLO